MIGRVGRELAWLLDVECVSLFRYKRKCCTDCGIIEEDRTRILGQRVSLSCLGQCCLSVSILFFFLSLFLFLLLTSVLQAPLIRIVSLSYPLLLNHQTLIPQNLHLQTLLLLHLEHPIITLCKPGPNLVFTYQELILHFF